MIKDGEQIAAELKVGANTTTPEQRYWLEAFDNVPGCTAIVWRPNKPAQGRNVVASRDFRGGGLRRHRAAPAGGDVTEIQAEIGRRKRKGWRLHSVAS